MENPPMNNWSVNQPSPPHTVGLNGNADLGMRDFIIDGINMDLVQQHAQINRGTRHELTQLLPIDAIANAPNNFLIEERDPSHSPQNLWKKWGVDNTILFKYTLKLKLHIAW